MKKNPTVRDEKLIPFGNIFLSRILLRMLSITVFFIAISLAPINVQAFSLQQNSVSGIITDVTGNTLPGVSVVVKGTTYGTITDVNGKYLISNLPAEATLVFYFMGMRTEEIPIGDQTVINLVMVEDVLGLEEIVVVGYGEQRRINMTGAVTTVRSEELVKVPAANVSQILIGKASGLLSKQQTGIPGDDFTQLRIRGYGSPLVLVDGIETSWVRLDPNEIESISILKDAAAAIYGARAGNGVILIQTKRGEISKPTITFTSNLTYQQPTTVPEWVSSWKYAEMVREGEFNSGLSYRYSEEDIQKFKDGTDPNYPNTSWYDESFTSWAPMQTYNLGARGGNEDVQFYISGGYLDQASIFRSGDLSFKRYNARVNLDAKVTEGLKVSLDMSYRNELRYQPESGFVSISPINNIWTDLMLARPVFPAHLPDPKKGGAFGGFTTRSPYAQTVAAMTGFIDERQDYLDWKINLAYKIPGIEGLIANAAFKYNTNNTTIKRQDKPFEVFQYDYDNDEYISMGINGENLLDEHYRKFSQLYPLISLNYDNTFGKHSVQGLLLTEFIDTKSSNLYAGRINLLSLEMPYLFAGSTDNLSNMGGASETARMSYVGRANYGFMHKYLLEATFRYDASHRFPENSRWGFFPSVSAAWRLQEESFVKDNIPWIDNLKLRVSYSQTGRDDVAAFRFLTGYSLLDNPTDIYLFGNNVYRQIRATGMANPDITWFDITSYNIGLETMILNGLFGFEVDVFYRLVDNIFGQPLETYPSTFGAVLPQLNINSTDNRGFELMLNHRKRLGNDLSYFVTGTVTMVREKYVKWSEPTYTDPDEIRIYQMEGNYTNRWIGYVSDGIFMTQEEIDNHPVNQDQAGNTSLVPGDIKYIDLNGDGIIDWRDQDVIGRGGYPDLNFGLNLQIQYKRFNISALFQGASLFNNHITQYRSPLSNMGTPFEFHYKYRWQPDPDNPGVNINPNAKLPALRGDGTGAGANNLKTSDFWLMDGTYLRLRNLNISYTLPGVFGVQNINMYVAGSNLLTFSRLGIYKKSQDPEATQGQQYYPPVKTLSFGLNITI